MQNGRIILMLCLDGVLADEELEVCIMKNCTNNYMQNGRIILMLCLDGVLADEELEVKKGSYSNSLD